MTIEQDRVGIRMAIQAGIKPLTGSSIAWVDFLKNVVSLSGYSPTRNLDASGLKLEGYAKFLATLGEFQTQNSEILKFGDDLLDHLSFGFLIWGPTNLIWNMFEKTDLKIISTKIKGGRVAVVSGTLKDWKYAVINCLQISSSEDLQWIFNEVFDIFYKVGLGNIWNNYERKNNLLEYSKF